MAKGSVASIESFGLVDGPGIRTVVFLNGCKLRCKYCHNPEMWTLGKSNMTKEELLEKILRFKPYFKRNKGGVTFSGGEPLLQIDFLIETCKLLKEHDIHIALDTAGVGVGKYEQLLPYIDLVLFDVKYTTPDGFLYVTGNEDKEVYQFLKEVNKQKKEVWVRQVIVPGLMDNEKYLYSLKKYLETHIDCVTRVDFLPYHKLGSEKYEQLGIPNPYQDKKEMNEEICKALYQQFLTIYKPNQNTDV